MVSSSAVAWAQGAPAPVAERVTVIGVREVLGVSAERSLTEEDISSYGFGSIGELLDEVVAETGESREEGVFLVNGDRVTGLGEVEDFPTEAVERIDVLPVGAAAKVGSSATRRVYNIVLKRQVDTVAVRAALRAAVAGDWLGKRADASYTRIRGAQRINLAAKARHEDRLLESDRDIEQPAGSPTGLGDARTLRPDLAGFDLKFSAADQLAPWLQGSVSGELGTTDRTSLLGLVPLSLIERKQDRDSTSGQLNVALNAETGSWLVSLIGEYSYDHSATQTDRLDPGDALAIARSRAESTTHIANADLTATGHLFTLPAGALRATAGVGVGRDSVDSEHRFLGVSTDNHYVHNSRSVVGALEVPIASRKNGVLPAIGELLANVELRQTRVSHFGSFTNQTFALQWQPADHIRLFGSITNGRTPPSVSSLADPIIETPGVRYLDPLNGETVDVTQITGGNPELGTQRNENLRLSLNIKPARSLALQLFGDYYGVRNRDIVSSLPPASEFIIAAFPERFIRDLDGTLRVVDVRPVSFARQSEDRVRYGFNLNLPLGRNSRGGGRAGGPRLQMHAAHTWLLNSELLVRPDLEEIDLLSPNAIGLSGASRPRHQFDFTLGYADRGFGLRLSGQHRGKSYLNLMSDGTTDRLKFSPLTTLNLRAFASGPRLGDSQFLKGSRLTVAILNILDDKQRVQNSAGLTPLAYQRDYRDPLGRTIEIEFRKVF